MLQAADSSCLPIIDNTSKHVVLPSCRTSRATSKLARVGFWVICRVIHRVERSASTRHQGPPGTYAGEGELRGELPGEPLGEVLAAAAAGLT